MKFIKLTQIETMSTTVIAVDHIVEAYEQADGITVVSMLDREICVAESVSTIWDLLE